MDLREWLIIIGVIVLVAIGIDLIRRRRKQDELSPLDSGESDTDYPVQESSATDWEFPNGGSRVVDSERVSTPDVAESSFERRGLKTKFPTHHNDQEDDHPETAPEDLNHDDLDLKHVQAEEQYEEQQLEEHEREEQQRVKSKNEDSRPTDHDVAHETPLNATDEPEEHLDNTEALSASGTNDVPAGEEGSEKSITHHAQAAEHASEEPREIKDENTSTVSDTADASAEDDDESKKGTAEATQSNAVNEGADHDHPEQSTPEGSVDEEKAHDGNDHEEGGYEGNDDEGDEDEENGNGRHYHRHFSTEEEHVDDPRYEGLSEILLRRPMDGVARLQEAAAERREKRAIKREEARIRRLEDRARRAEERAKRREEQERQAEIRRQERAEQQRLEAEKRQQEEQKRREEDEKRRQASLERQRKLREQQQHASYDARDSHANAYYDDEERAEYKPSSDYRDDPQAHYAHGTHRPQESYRDYDDENDPLFAPPHRGNERYSDSVPYLGAVDTFDEERYDSRDPEPRYSNDDHGINGRHDEEESLYADDARDHPLREPEIAEPAHHQFHPIIDKALRTRVDGDIVMDVLSDADELVIINVVSRAGESFNGIELTRILLACGLVFAEEGEMFHRFETEDEDSNLQFSVINAMKPGRFPMLEMERFSTRGVSFLLPLPSAEDPSAAFEAMLGTAKVLVHHLNGDLRDENQSVMTSQTIEFIRQKVREFERRMRLHRY
ncbi:Cell division protein ZipA [Halomonadaceae bacterium LMG 33818]|uniref:cell division protein ZipA C-terminal FtsZ-binding domain-containing protein n=1 Tax=Cernens ardua TaxID=3402176 RepID=UPI003EDCACC0